MAHSSRGQKVLGNAKPFCECKTCSNKKCPNVLQELGVTLKDKASVKNTTDVVPKWSRPKKVDPKKAERMHSLLGIVNPDRTCNCAVVAKALHSDIHKNFGTLLNRGRTDKNASPSKDPDQHIKATSTPGCGRTDKDASPSNDPDQHIDATSTAGPSPPAIEEALPK